MTILIQSLSLDHQIIKIMKSLLVNKYSITEKITLEELNKINKVEQLVELAKNNLNGCYNNFVANVIINCASCKNISNKKILYRRLAQIFGLDYRIIEKHIQELNKIESKISFLDGMVFGTISGTIVTDVLFLYSFYSLMYTFCLAFLFFVISCIYFFGKKSLQKSEQSIIEELYDKSDGHA